MQITTKTNPLTLFLAAAAAAAQADPRDVGPGPAAPHDAPEPGRRALLVGAHRAPVRHLRQSAVLVALVPLPPPPVPLLSSPLPTGSPPAAADARTPGHLHVDAGLLGKDCKEKDRDLLVIS